MKMRIASLLLLSACCLMLAVAPAMADTIYDNGPVNGTTGAWTINFGYAVSDTIYSTTQSNIKEGSIGYWDASTTDVLTTVDVQIGTTAFGGSIQTSGPVTNTFLGTNQYGYALFEGDFAITGTEVDPGTSYLTLSNACTTSGCSVSNPIYWDDNSGVGCDSPGCPSQAFESGYGSIPSEAFTLEGTRGGTTPEPSSVLLFGSSILGLAGVLRRKLPR